MRQLSELEKMIVIGGATASEEEPKNVGKVTVHGSNPYCTVSSGIVAYPSGSFFGGGSAGPEINWDWLSEIDKDKQTRNVYLNLDPMRVYGDDALRSVDQFCGKVAEWDLAISRLDPNLIYALTVEMKVMMGYSPDANITMTGASIYDRWMRTDFIVNDAGTPYLNGGVGESAAQGGDPLVSINIDTILGYSTLPGGLDYLISHELGHSTEIGEQYSYKIWADNSLSQSEHQTDEQFSNDFSRLISTLTGKAVLANPGYGYTNGITSYPTNPPAPTPVPAPPPAPSAPSPRNPNIQQYEP